jgi:predicted methyltransferase
MEYAACNVPRHATPRGSVRAFFTDKRETIRLTQTGPPRHIESATIHVRPDIRHRSLRACEGLGDVAVETLSRGFGAEHKTLMERG